MKALWLYVFLTSDGKYIFVKFYFLCNVNKHAKNLNIQYHMKIVIALVIYVRGLVYIHMLFALVNFKFQMFYLKLLLLFNS